MIDFHSHVLPGVDDGSASVEESMALLRVEAEQGITHVVATPHFYPNYDDPAHFLRSREEAFEKLNAEMAAESGLPTLILGAEVYYFRGISESEWLDALKIEGTDCVLIEMPAAPWPDSALQELENIWVRQHIRPIIAHLDRYLMPFQTRSLLRKLSQLPVLVQTNGDFFLNRETASLALKMLKADQIHLLGSDCHNMADRQPNLGAVQQRIRQRLGDAALESIRQYETQILGVSPM